MMKKLLFTFFLTVFGLIIMAQTAGDFKSLISTGNPLEWQEASTWLTYVGTAWEPATAYPAEGETDITYTVTIQSGSDVVFGMAPSPFTLNIGNAGQSGEVIVENGAVLAVFSSYDFIISENGIVTVEGSLNCTGDIINNGELTINGSYSIATP